MVSPASRKFPQPPPSAAPSKPVPWFITLLTQQRADGSFILTAEFIETLEISEREVDKLLSESRLESSVFATALAIITFQRRAGSESDIWGAAAEKAMAWLDREGQKVVLHPCEWLEMKLKQEGYGR